MNIHARNHIYRLTMVSLFYRGRSRAYFVRLPVVDGKVILAGRDYDALTKGLQPGTLVGIGY